MTYPLDRDGLSACPDDPLCTGDMPEPKQINVKDEIELKRTIFFLKKENQELKEEFDRLSLTHSKTIDRLVQYQSTVLDLRQTIDALIKSS